MLKQLNSLVLFVFILLLSAPADAQVWNKRKMDEAAAKNTAISNSTTYPDELYSSLSLDSQPTVLTYLAMEAGSLEHSIVINT